MRKLPISILFFSFFLSLELLGQNIRPVSQGPIHEAFITRVAENYVVNAIPHAPPPPVQERIPPQIDPEMEWIPGYWNWDERWHDFLWVPGIWRRPPPDHIWIRGYWEEFPEGFVWISGFWSTQLENAITFIEQAPPDQIDEEVDYPPSNDYFWVPGHWRYYDDVQDFFWSPGRWELLDPYWIYVPSHYVWRPEGYVYIPGFWDWPIEERGDVYSSIFIEAGERENVVYEPTVIIEQTILIRELFVYLPDYSCFFYHHYHYHPEFWHDEFCCTPPWWSWNTWWCYTWHDNWGLWWWYSHPGYPQPQWMTAEIVEILPPPQQEFFGFFRNVEEPVIVLENGVVPPNNLLRAIKRETGEDLPILPASPNLRSRIENNAKPFPIDSRNIRRPSGRRLPLLPDAVRPRVPKPQIQRGEKPARVRPINVPQKPVGPRKRPGIHDRAPGVRQPDVRGQRPDIDKAPGARRPDVRGQRPEIDRTPGVRRPDVRGQRPGLPERPSIRQPGRDLDRGPSVQPYPDQKLPPRLDDRRRRPRGRLSPRWQTPEIQRPDQTGPREDSQRGRPEIRREIPQTPQTRPQEIQPDRERELKPRDIRSSRIQERRIRREAERQIRRQQTQPSAPSVQERIQQTQPSTQQRIQRQREIRLQQLQQQTQPSEIRIEQPQPQPQEIQQSQARERMIQRQREIRLQQQQQTQPSEIRIEQPQPQPQVIQPSQAREQMIQHQREIRLQQAQEKQATEQRMRQESLEQRKAEQIQERALKKQREEEESNPKLHLPEMFEVK